MVVESGQSKRGVESFVTGSTGSDDDDDDLEELLPCVSNLDHAHS